MEVRVIGFETFKDLYENDVDFGGIWTSCQQGSFQPFSIFDGFLFNNNALCVPCYSLRLTILTEVHEGALRGHFRRDKTLALVQANFYWPKLKRNVDRLVKQCHVNERVKEIKRLH